MEKRVSIAKGRSLNYIIIEIIENMVLKQT